MPATESRQSLAERAYEAIYRRVIRCELGPGERITEAALVESLGMGKTPIREALTRLVKDELVRSIPGHGYEIAPITLLEVSDLYGLRAALEPAAAEIVAARIAAGQIDTVAFRRLDRLCRRRHKVGHQASLERWLQANKEFHSAVAVASGNRRLEATVHDCLDGTERLLRVAFGIQDLSATLGHGHQELLDALEAGDGPRAKAAMRSHIEYSLQVVLGGLVGAPAIQLATISKTRA